MYIAIEGCIASGKTTLVNEINKTLGYHSIIGDFCNNPFLSGFYNNDFNSLLPTEIAFVLIHYKQLLSGNIGQNIISDFSMMSNIVFGEINITEPKAKKLFLEVHEYLLKLAPNPDIIILLQGDSNFLYNRIKRRNQLHDKQISFEYLDKLNTFYKNNYRNILCQKSIKVIEINVANFDFINNKRDIDELCEMVKNVNKRGNYSDV